MTNDYIGEFEFELSGPIKYSSAGNTDCECYKLILKAPSNLLRKQARKMRSLVTRGIYSLSQSNDANSKEIVKEGSENKKEVEDMTGSQLATLLYASNTEMDELHDAFESLLLSGACFLEQGVKLTKYHYDLLSLDDSDRLLGEYIKNFIMSSLMKA